jgi:hypothetical protein
MQRFVQQKTFKNYRELLANERAKTERMFLLKVLVRKEAENRRPSALQPFPSATSRLHSAEATLRKVDER